jgi:hypothetical protein
MMPVLGLFSGFSVSPAVVAFARVNAIAVRILLLEAQRANAVIARLLWQCARRAVRQEID